MKKILLIIFCLCSISFASSLDDYYKIYSKDADILFMNALSAVNTNPKFKVVEIQSKNGYILFLYESKYYLLTLTKRYQNQTEIKVMPQNSDFSQGSDVARSVFALIDLQLRIQPVEQVK